MAKTTAEDEFLKKLTDLFLAEGISNLTVGEIASRMQCSRRRLYGIAETKEDIFHAMTMRFFNEVLDEGEALIQGQQQDLTVALTAYLDVGVRAAGRMSARFLKDLEETESARACFDAYQQARARRFSQLIDQGVSEGVFIQCHGQVVSEMMLGAALRIRRAGFLAQANLTLEEAFAEFYRVVLTGLLSDTSAVSPRQRNNPNEKRHASTPTRKSKSGNKPGPADDTKDRLLIAAWDR
ncbi:TetR family transcriptional regulator [Burkholderia anthina]|uniref:TetR/AcrR family transcriptional regulator n=1 Tax=Burkholderia anthina TaxID=179879 RepID=UPI00158D6442